MIPLLLSLTSPGGSRGRLSTLIFHRVLREPDPLFPDEIDAARFDEMCAWLRQWFAVLPLDAACRRLREGSLPARALAITFDDGYADNHDVALPLLRKHGLPATFFVATGFLDGGRMWNDTVIESVRLTRRDALELVDAGLRGISRLPMGTLAERRQAIDALLKACKYLAVEERHAATQAIAKAAAVLPPSDLMMRSSQVTALHRAGMGVGGHTVNHPILARLSPAAARAEMQAGKATLEALTQAPVTTFAYPNGKPGQDFEAPHAEMAKGLGFEFAVTTAWGAADRASDPHQLPRFTPWDRSRWAFGLRMARNLRTRAVPLALRAKA